MSNAGWKWNPAPGWPEAPRGWVPPEGWTPDPGWPPAPSGWQFWLPEDVSESSRDGAAFMSAETATSEFPPVAPVAEAEADGQQKAGRSRWFGRPTVAVVAGVTGLIIGLASAGDTDAVKKEAEKDAQTKIARIQGQTDELVDDAKAEARADEQEAIDAAVATAVATEKARRAKLIKAAVTKAVKDTKADLKASTEPKPLVSASDPRFDTCGAANAAGYGTYRRGVDPEYDWYDDRDNDGVVCE